MENARTFYAKVKELAAETPAEIAISVVAEIINVYRGGRARSLSAALREDRRLPLHPARVEAKKS